jgi:Zinc finger C-x8-C-x5-C-x3-H type (and similar)/RNA-binding, Nab2-type zinc finger
MSSCTISSPATPLLDLAATPKMPDPCKFYVRKACTKGASCKFDHEVVDAARAQGCCIYAIVSECTAGAACKYKHKIVGDIKAAAGLRGHHDGHHGAHGGRGHHGGHGGEIVALGGKGRHGGAVILSSGMPSLPHGVPAGGAITYTHTTTTKTIVTAGGAGHAITAVGAKPAKAPKRPLICDIALSFDTTGSMYSYLDQVKTTIKDVCGEVHRRLISKDKEKARGAAEAPRKTVRYSIIAHGDYCDKSSSYVIKWKDFDTNAAKLKEFVDDCGRTGGGDGDECYELALHTAQSRLSWDSKSAVKILVLFGDANPHNTSYPMNTHKYDWRKEAQALKSKGIVCFPVHCGGSSSSKPFYEEVARITGGQVLSLSYGNAPDVTQLITGLCLKAASEKKYKRYEDELKAAGKASAAVFSQLSVIRITRTEYHFSGATGSGGAGAAAGAGAMASLTSAMAGAYVSKGSDGLKLLGDGKKK